MFVSYWWIHFKNKKANQKRTAQDVSKESVSQKKNTSETGDIISIQSKKRRVVALSDDDLDAFEDPPEVKTVTEKKKQRSVVKIEKKQPTQAKTIPTTNNVKTTRRNYSSWRGPSQPPPKHGSKPIPTGKSECLQGKYFVLSGLNESLTRDEMSELIKDHGGYSCLFLFIKGQYKKGFDSVRTISLQVFKWRMEDLLQKERSIKKRWKKV